MSELPSLGFFERMNKHGFVHFHSSQQTVEKGRNIKVKVISLYMGIKTNCTQKKRALAVGLSFSQPFCFSLNIDTSEYRV